MRFEMRFWEGLYKEGCFGFRIWYGSKILDLVTLRAQLLATAVFSMARGVQCVSVLLPSQIIATEDSLPPMLKLFTPATDKSDTLPAAVELPCLATSVLTCLVALLCMFSFANVTCLYPALRLVPTVKNQQIR